MNNIEIGRFGEEIAVRHLLSDGYSILERNKRVGWQEIDILAEKHGKRILFEIKSVAREIIATSDISREIFSASSRYTGEKCKNVTLSALYENVDDIFLICVAISISDRKTYVRVFEGSM